MPATPPAISPGWGERTAIGSVQAVAGLVTADDLHRRERLEVVAAGVAPGLAMEPLAPSEHLEVRAAVRLALPLLQSSGDQIKSHPSLGGGKLVAVFDSAFPLHVPHG